MRKQWRKWCLRGVGVVAVVSLAYVAIQELPYSSAVAETQTSSVSVDTTSAFIDSIAETASQIGQEYDLYASVLIAQAVLESSSGQSELSQAPYYNLFGIKGDYYGSSVTMSTWEDDGAGNVSQVDADFRAYSSYAESLYDYAALLATDTYAGTWRSNTTSYTDATAALTGLYATDTSYQDKLNSIIATYGLTAYDTTSSEASSDYVWNSYRGAYTSADTLAEDEVWASANQ